MSETVFVDLVRGVRGPKLNWLQAVLTNNNIPFKVSGMSFKGHRILVPEDYLVQASGIYNESIGEIIIGADSNVTWGGLDNDHPIFDSPEWYQGQNDSPVGAGFVLPYEDFYFPLEGNRVRMFEVDSSNMSGFGYQPMSGTPEEIDPDEWAMPDEAAKSPSGMTLYVRFKGGTHYRYFPVPLALCEELKSEAERKAQGIQEASVGSLFHHQVKVKADEGTLIHCQRLTEDGEHWTDVLPKAQRTQAIKKQKYE